MRSITIVSSYPLSEPVVKNRLEPIIRSFRAHDIKINLVCPQGGSLCSDLESYVNYIGLRLPSRPTRGFIIRAFFEYKIAKRLLKTAGRLGSSATLVTVPSMFLLMAFVSKSDQNYVDIRDLTWEYLSDRRFVAGLAKKFFRMRVRAKIKKFDLVSVTNQTEKEYVTSRLEVGAQKVVYLPNGIGLSQFDMLGAVPSASKLTDIIKVYYIGNVGLAQDLSTLVAAAQKLPHFQFFVVGEGTDFVRVRDQAISAKLQNMTFTGRVSWEDVPAYYADADILYAQLTSDYSGAMPSKLYEYLASGKYIIYGGEKQAISVLKDFDHNLVVPPSDSPALVDALLEVEKSGAWRDFSKNNRELISKLYIREHTAMNLVNRVIDL